jgi:hypothetical protein
MSNFCGVVRIIIYGELPKMPVIGMCYKNISYFVYFQGFLECMESKVN